MGRCDVDTPLPVSRLSSTSPPESSTLVLPQRLGRRLSSRRVTGWRSLGVSIAWCERGGCSRCVRLPIESPVVTVERPPNQNVSTLTARFCIFEIHSSSSLCLNWAHRFRGWNVDKSICHNTNTPASRPASTRRGWSSTTHSGRAGTHVWSANVMGGGY